jgi:hypothetical protein
MNGGLEAIVPCAGLFKQLLNFCLANFIHLKEMPFVSEQGAVEGIFVASQLNALERLG